VTGDGVLISSRTPLFGRVEELGKLKEQLSEAERTSTAKVALISGDPGLGKTRLAQELLQIAEMKGFKVMKGRCFPDNLTPYLPLFEALKNGNMDHLASLTKPPKVEYVLLINPSGLAVTMVKQEEVSLDMDIFSGMLTAATIFVKESMEKITKQDSDEGGLSSMGYGEYGIYLETRSIGSLVVFITGFASEMLKDEMRKIMNIIERDQSEFVSKWDGERDRADPIEDLLRPLLMKYDGVDYATEPKNRQDRFFDNIARGMKRETIRQPVLLFIDDLHWADVGTLTLLQIILAACKERSFLLVGTYQRGGEGAEDDADTPLSSLSQLMSQEGLLTEVNLEALDDEATRSLAKHMFGDVADGDLGDIIFNESQGNPFFAEEIAALLVKQGIVAMQNGKWEIISELKASGVPDKIRDMVKARLKHISREEMDVLECGAVLGEYFKLDVVAGVLELDPRHVGQYLDSLDKKEGLVSPVPALEAYMFDHQLVREVIYSDLPADLRAEYHAIIAEYLKDEYEGGRTDLLPDLTMQAYLAEIPDSTDYCILTADIRRKEFNNEEAKRFYEMALKTCQENEKSGILESLGEVAFQAGNFEEALDWYSQAYAATVLKSERVLLIAKQARTLDRLGTQDKALEILKKEPPDAETSPLSIARWLSTRAWISYMVIDLESSEKDAMDALSSYESVEKGAAQDLADCWNTLGAVSHSRGRNKDAITRFKNGLKVALSGKQYYQACRILSNLSLCYESLGELEEALEFSLRTMELAKKTGNNHFIAIAFQRRGVFLCEKGQLDEAWVSLEKGFKRCMELGAKTRATTCKRNLAYCALEKKDLEQAEILAEECMEMAQSNPEELLFAKLVMGEVLLAKGDVEASEGAIQQVVHGFRGTETTGWLGEAMLKLAHVLVRKGQKEEAEGTFRQAFDEYGDNMSRWKFAQGLRYWGEALIEWGEEEEGQAKLDQSLAMFDKMGAELEAAKVRNILKTKDS
jgi:tetratricopeptide (TPR) repeat protein